MTRFKPKDIIAVIVIAGLIVFKLTGHDGSLDIGVAIIIGYYFAKRSNGEDNGE